ncbi:helicase C-terminal domain-containing protein [Bradyrhizobium japonicum]
MQEEAFRAAVEFQDELSRVKQGIDLLREKADLRRGFCLMNRAMQISARGRYFEWRPFQLAFLLANMRCLVEPTEEATIVDIVWFATGGGKTETYLGLLITAALLDRLRGKTSGITAWSRFPLRLLSLQQTQRFANALAAAELVRRDEKIAGDPFSLGFLVGGSATPNRVRKEAIYEGDWDADKIDDTPNAFRIIETCPVCRSRSVKTAFDRKLWKLTHFCSNSECSTAGEDLPLYVIDDEIWRFLPTVVVGTLDKAANIARQSGMRSLVGSPWGLCTRPGHGYTYARRNDRKNGCLVPDCTGGNPTDLPIDQSLYAPTFRLQDELHLLRDSLGAVDAHYEAALDSMQEQLSGSKPKILASSATLTGYKKQVAVLYRRAARVFPQPPPRDGGGFWTADSDQLMRRYIALAPRQLTVEFVVDRLVVTLQSAIRQLIKEPNKVCSEIQVDSAFSDFLINLYGTNVIYGNTLQDLDAVVRSSETQYAGLDPAPNVETLTGRTGFDDVREILDRLENPEPDFDKRLHLVAASSMMSHGVDIDRLNIMVMLALPLSVAEFIQATARVGRRWPSIVIVVPKMTRERDASVYRAFPQFVSHGDRFVEAIPITRKSRRVLERTLAGLELARLQLIHEPSSKGSLTTPRHLNALLKEQPQLLDEDREAIKRSLELSPLDEFLNDQVNLWFEGMNRNLREPTADIRFISDLSPTGKAMLSLRDVEEQSPIAGDNS